MIESAFALMVAFLINISVISVSGAVCNSSNLSAEDQNSCQDLDLNKASFLLRVCNHHHLYLVLELHISFLLESVLIKSLMIIFYVVHTQECLGQMEFKTICNCFTCLRSKFYHNRNICRAIRHAGLMFFLLFFLSLKGVPVSTFHFTLISILFQGFLDLRLKSWIRNLLTRCLAIVPSLIVALIGGSAGAGELIIIASV